MIRVYRLIRGSLSIILAVGLASCATSAGDLQSFIASADPPQLRALTGYLADRRLGTTELSRLTTHRDASVRSSAVIALAQIEVAEAAPAIVHAMSDENPAVRQHAAFSAGQIGGDWAMRAIIKRLGTERHPRVRSALWMSLGRVGTAQALPVLKQAKGFDRPHALGALAHVLRREEQPAWLDSTVARAADDGDAKIRAAAFYAMHRAKKPAPLWVKKRAASSLNAGDGHERDMAIRLLRKGVDGVEAGVSAALMRPGLHAHQRAALIQGLARTSGSNSTFALVRVVRAEALRLIQKQSLVHTAYHPFLAALQGLNGRPLSAVERGELDGIHRAMSERIQTPSVAARRRINRMKCAFHLLSGSMENCTDLERVHGMAAAGKSADENAIRSYANHPSPAVRIAHLHALHGTTDDLRADLLKAFQDEDLPVVATAADLARQKSIGGADIVRQLDAQWGRIRDGGNLEVLVDVLRSMNALDTARVMEALQWALQSEHLVLARLASELITKRTGEETDMPSRSIYPFNVEDVSTYRRDSGMNTARITTDVGSFTIRLRTDWAPQTVRHFVSLARTGFYDGLSFHRVVPYFVVQGGDPRGDGWGGSKASIRCENNPLPYTRGAVGMALAGKDTGGSQWFVTHASQPHLFGRYTVFGNVVSGQDTVDSIVAGDAVRKIELSRRAWGR